MALLLALVLGAQTCGPGRGAGRRRGPRKLTPLVFKQHVPNVAENTMTASGATEGRIGRNDTRFQDLVPNYNDDIVFKDEEGTGADRLMTQRCQEKLNTLAISVMNQWPGVRLYVIEGWVEENDHSPESLHYEGRAVDISTSDRDRAKFGMLARLAVEAGFDWVYYESRTHIHCSVKSESSQAAKYGGCFTGDTTVLTHTGAKKTLANLNVGDKILAHDPATNRLVFSEVLLFLDFDPMQRREFLKITLRSGRTLTVTGTHLVMTDSAAVYAETLKIGDTLLVSDSNNFLSTYNNNNDIQSDVTNNDRLVVVGDEIVRIETILKTGVYAPLTEVGTLVVNDVVASCYATVDSQSIAHWAFMPLRMTHRIESGAVRLWKFITGNDISDSDAPVAKPSVGVHWYARMLYKTADYLMSSHMHK